MKLILFFKLPCPGLSWKIRLILSFASLLCFYFCAHWLQTLGWPNTHSVSYAILILPIMLISIPLGFIGALIGSLAASNILLLLGDADLNYSEILLKVFILVSIAVFVSIYAHLQGYYQRKLYFLISHDLGTHLPNRLSLWKELDCQLDKRSKGVFQNGLAVIEIENLKDISATFSYEVSDILIADLWKRLVDVFYPGAQAYHYHHDRLAVLFHHPGDDLEALMRSLTERFEESVVHDGIPIHFNSIIGFVRLNGNDKRYVINQAEAAIEYAREQGKQAQIYSSGMERDRKKNLILLGDLLKSLSDNTISLHYQPKINLESMTIAGYEALARWNHPKLGNISPDEFIPLVEQTDCIHTFTLWAIDQALRSIKKHWFEEIPPVTIAVNISSRNLVNRNFTRQVRGLLTNHQLPSNYLELEITEGEIMKNPELAIEVLENLADIPLVISIDDFGTGYSSLAYLHRLPATIIKIDRAFISKVNHDDGVYEIVLAAINLAHALGMKVVAEGIETEQQLITLKEMGCDIGQGYYFSPAMPIEQATQWRVESVELE